MTGVPGSDREPRAGTATDRAGFALPLEARLRVWASVQPEQGDFRGELLRAADEVDELRAALARLAAQHTDTETLATVDAMRLMATERAVAAEARVVALEAHTQRLETALPTDAEIARLKEQAEACCRRASFTYPDLTHEERWNRYGKHIVTIADRMQQRRAAALAAAEGDA